MKTALPFIIAFGIVILIRILASTDNIAGKICRWFWNTSFKIAAYIPFCGWMAHFIIGEERELYIGIGQRADAMGSEMLDESVRRERETERRREAARIELAQQGYTDCSINSDGTGAVGYDSKGKKCNITFKYDN